jgi:tRNA A37 threonylcarbamoyladenosine dehydratase
MGTGTEENRLKFVAAFALGASAFALSQYLYQHAYFASVNNTKKHILQQQQQQQQQQRGRRVGGGGSNSMEDSLLKEQLSRIHSFFGEKGFQNIRNAFVIVVGLGGVGSHAAHMLARSGIKKMRLIDFDQVTLSSLNRHAVATREDVGISKVACMKKHLLEIIPDCEIEDLCIMFEKSNAEELLQGEPTFVLDCIDDVNTKVELLSTVVSNNIRVITATSAGAKADPTRIQIGTLNDCLRDPLASKIRYFLKKKSISSSKITTVYSSEKSICKLLPLDAEQAQNPKEFGNVENFRIRVIPVLGTMPALFGQSMAAYVLTDLAGQTIQPEALPRLSREVRNKLFQKLQDRERKIFCTTTGSHKDFLIEKDEIEFVYQEIWHGRSAISGVRQGGHERMYLTRWRKEKPLTPGNMVFLTTKEIDRMDSSKQDLEKAFGKEIVKKIDQHLATFGTWE